MKKKEKILFAIVSVALVVVVVLIVYKRSNHQNSQPLKKDANIIQLKKIKDTGEFPDGFVLTSYDQFQLFFESDEISEEDFKNNHYVLLNIQKDSCAEEDITPTNFSVKKNKYIVTIKFKAKCGVCAPEWLYYVIKVDKSVMDAEVEYKYQAINKPNCDPNIDYKPMIYLYPEEEQEVSVVLGNPDYLISTYPKYHNKWEVSAFPDGTLKDETGREYYGLYWEGNQHQSRMDDEGFVVKGEETLTFLEEKLQQLGLTDKEANEFIVYWLPKLEQNPYNYIYFENMEEINQYMPLEITPKPDTIIRIQMDYKALTKRIKVKEQELLTKERVGFTVVEWGGSPIS